MAKKEDPGDTTSISLLGLGGAIGGTSKAIGRVYERRVEAEIANEIQRRMVERAQIAASKSIVETQQKEFSKRHRTYAETKQTVVNQSDEIINALNPIFYECRWRKGRKNHHLRLSPMALCALGPIFKELGIMLENSALQGLGSEYNNYFEHLVDHAEEMNRTATAGEMNYNFPEEQTGVIPNMPPVVQGLTREEIATLISTTMTGSPGYYQEPPTEPPPVRYDMTLIEDLKYQIQKAEAKLESLKTAYMAFTSEASVFYGEKERARMDEYKAQIRKLKRQLAEAEAGTVEE